MNDTINKIKGTNISQNMSFKSHTTLNTSVNSSYGTVKATEVPESFDVVSSASASIKNNSSSYMSKDKTTSMLKKNMYAIAKLNPNSKLEVNPKGVETDRAGHQYLTFTLTDENNNKELFTYRVNGDNTLQNTVHYMENADGTHIRWREGMTVDSTVNGYTKKQADNFRKYGDTLIGLAKQKAKDEKAQGKTSSKGKKTSKEDTKKKKSSNSKKTSNSKKYVTEKKANQRFNSVVNAKDQTKGKSVIKDDGTKKDRDGHYYRQFTVKDTKGNTVLYNYRINKDNNMECVVKYSKNKDGTYSYNNKDSNILETKTKISNTNSYKIVRKNTKTGKILYTTTLYEMNGKKASNDAKTINKPTNDAGKTMSKSKTDSSQNIQKVSENIMKKVENSGRYITDADKVATKSALASYYGVPENQVYDKLKTSLGNTNLSEDNLITYVNTVQSITKSDDFNSILSNTSYLIKSDYTRKVLYMTPTLKNGTIKTSFKMNGVGDTVYSNPNYSYTGDYLEYYSPTGCKVTAPLADFKCDTKGGKEYTTPMSETYKSKYIKALNNNYYVTQKNTGKYATKFKKTVDNSLDNISFIYSSTRDNFDYLSGSAAYVTQNYNGTGFDSNRTCMLISGDEIMRNLDNDPEYMVNSYIHECGHVYADSTFRNGTTIDYTSPWTDVYDQISKNKDAYSGILRDYTLTNSAEMFGDLTMMYYTEPRKLKMIDIDVDYNGTKYTNAYDLMHAEMND